MSLSKEHVLVLGTLAILTLLHLSRGDAGPVKRVRPGAAPPHDVPELPPDIFAGPGEAFDLERNRFLRPSDTVPLPLLKYPELPIPEDPPLPVLAPPIRPGPGLAHWYLNRIDARKLDLENAPAAAGKAEGEAVSPNGGNPAPGQEQGGEGGERQGPGNENHGLTYDRIFLDKGGPKWGYVQGKGELKYLHGTPDPKELLACVAPFREDVQFRIINVDKETQVMTLSYKPQSVTRIVFANNIHNRIQMDLRRVPSGTAGLSNLEALIRKWISEEQDHIEALQAAEEQADRYIRTASDDPKGYELKAEVFATTHQFEKELALYQELMEGELGDRPFVLRGLGRLEEKLGMHKAAEGHLRAAIAQDPS
ncbi:MAG: tetratricopeptide repeat protein, partial [Planctomycetota bacterium]